MYKNCPPVVYSQDILLSRNIRDCGTNNSSTSGAAEAQGAQILCFSRFTPLTLAFKCPMSISGAGVQIMARIAVAWILHPNTPRYHGLHFKVYFLLLSLQVTFKHNIYKSMQRRLCFWMNKAHNILHFILRKYFFIYIYRHQQAIFAVRQEQCALLKKRTDQRKTRVRNRRSCFALFFWSRCGECLVM